MLSYFRLTARERPFFVARWVALVVLATAGAAWLWAHEGHEPLPTRGATPIKDKDGRVTGVLLSREAREALGLQTLRVEKRPMPRRVLAYASLTTPWQRHAFATARPPGRIEKLHVRAGDVVRAGQILADVRSADLENLQRELLAARADGKLSAKLLASLTESFKGGSGSALSVQEAAVKHQQNVNALAIAQARWASLGLPPGDVDRLLREGRPVVSTLPVRSPIAGTITHADLNVGKVVEPAEHLFEVVDLASVWAQVGVLERDLHWVSEGQTVELTFPAYPGETFRTNVQVKGAYLDPQTHLNTVWAELANPAGKEPRFLPGLSAQAELVLPSPEASVVVPAGAVIHDGVESYVLVEGADTPEGSEYLKTPIVTGRRSGDWIEVLGGDVFPGGYVVTRGSHQLASFFVPGVLRLSPEAQREVGLKVESVGLHEVESVTQVEGSVDVPPDRRAAVSAQVAGTLEWVGVDRGQEVRAGQEIARVLSLDLQSMQLEMLRSDLEMKLTEDTLTRLRKAEDSVPASQLWETESRRNTLRQSSETLSRKLLALGLSAEQLTALREKKVLLRSLPVRAPISGRVVRFDKVLGQALKAEEVLFEIHDLSDPLIQGFVAEADLAHVRPGQKARVRLTADPSFVGEATVMRSGRVLGGESRVLSVWVKLDNSPAVPLLHNQLARLTLVRGQAGRGLCVPLGAIVREGTRSFVFVRQKDGTFDRRAVEVGAADDRRVLVTRGLAEGEPVAVAGAAALQTAYASIR